MKVLLTNDDGIQATGLNAMRRALLEVPGVELAVIAPDSNRSATARSITTREPLWVEEIEFGDGTVGYATDGTPVDCVRFAALGLVEFEPELIVSGINHGSNLGDDITYSGTVAAAMEGLLSGLPSIAISIAAFGANIDFAPSAAFAALLARNIFDKGFAPDALLNVNVPALPRDAIAGVEVTRLGKRTYRDQLVERLDPYGNPYYWVGGPAVSAEAEEGTDVAALRAGKISVTPIYLDLTNHALIAELAKWDWGWSGPVEVAAD